ncbi:MAG: NAD-binding protein [bacterium]|nr:NAD-binding protein [bacterium]
MTRYGFVGLGIMGNAMATNLLKAGFQVTVWNRNPSRCDSLAALGAQVAESPRETAAASDVTFAMLSDPAASLEVCFGSEGVLRGIRPGCGYIESSTIDAATSRSISEAVKKQGGRYLEAPVSGSKKPAEDGALIFLAAGDESLYQETAAAFDAMGKKHLFLGEVGQGARMKLVINMILGGMMATFCEGLALGEKSGLDGGLILEILDAGAAANPMFRVKGAPMLKGEFPASFPLKHMQKDMHLALACGDELGLPLHCTATANEIYKQARAAGSEDEDFSAIFQVIKQR